ncbi:MAG: lysozyme inhibitor LprI family protein [Parachlamydiaceae bacterium]
MPKLFLIFIAVGVGFLNTSSAHGAECEKKELWAFDEKCLKEVVSEKNEQIEKSMITLMSLADKKRQALLKASQESWRAYQKDQCMLEFDNSRAMHYEYSQVGSIAPSDNLRCLIRLDEWRLTDLRAQLARSKKPE